MYIVIRSINATLRCKSIKSLSICILFFLSLNTKSMHRTKVSISSDHQTLLIEDVSGDPYLSSTTVLEEVIMPASSATQTLQGTFRCFRCLQRISNEAFYHHMQTHQVQPAILYKCFFPACRYRYATLLALQKHYLIKHNI